MRMQSFADVPGNIDQIALPFPECTSRAFWEGARRLYVVRPILAFSPKDHAKYGPIQCSALWEKSTNPSVFHIGGAYYLQSVEGEIAACLIGNARMIVDGAEYNVVYPHRIGTQLRVVEPFTFDPERSNIVYMDGSSIPYTPANVGDQCGQVNRSRDLPTAASRFLVSVEGVTAGFAHDLSQALWELLYMAPIEKHLLPILWRASSGQSWQDNHPVWIVQLKVIARNSAVERASCGIG